MPVDVWTGDDGACAIDGLPRPRVRRRGPGRTMLLVTALAAGGLTLVPAVAGRQPAATAAGAGATALGAPAVEAWIYPGSTGEPTCHTGPELAALAAAPVALLKPEYLVVTGRGVVRTETAAALPCNGFSAANLAQVRSAAARVYVTVSAGKAGVRGVLASAALTAGAASAIESFVTTNSLDGVDLDFEPGRWSPRQWQRYMGLVSSVSAALAPAGRGVEVDLDAFTATPWDAERYADVAAAGAHLVVMAYDHEYDAPCAPISPYAWLQAVVAYAGGQVPAADLTVGLPAYGYSTTTCSRVAHVTSNVPYLTMEQAPGFPTTPAATDALRDPASGEIRWLSGGTFYDYVDTTALNAKLQTVEAMGAGDVSVWSLGGEPWFTGNPG